MLRIIQKLRLDFLVSDAITLYQKSPIPFFGLGVPATSQVLGRIFSNLGQLETIGVLVHEADE